MPALAFSLSVTRVCARVLCVHISVCACTLVCVCVCKGSVTTSLESEFKWCKVHLSLPSDCFFPLMCMFVCVQKG